MTIQQAAARRRFDVAVINYNTAAHLRTCLASVLGEAPHTIVVIDNASTDQSVDLVRSEFPEVHLYASPTNLGYGRAANLALAGCQAKYVLLLNSDTRLQQGALDALAAYFALHPNAAVVGPRLVNLDGSLQRSTFPFPTPLDHLQVLMNAHRAIGRIPLLREMNHRTWRHYQSRAVPWVLGAALALRRAVVVEVGGFDESFFMYSEEVDLCYRLRQIGWQTHYTPVTTVTHIRGASTSQQRVTMEITRVRNTDHFYHKHYPRRYNQQRKLIMATAMCIKIVRDTLRRLSVANRTRRSPLDDNLRIWWGTLVSLWERAEHND